MIIGHADDSMIIVVVVPTKVETVVVEFLSSYRSKVVGWCILVGWD